jgi:hypothetical protein
MNVVLGEKCSPKWANFTLKPQSLEVSKIKKNKKNFEKFWSSIINKGSYEM